MVTGAEKRPVLVIVAGCRWYFGNFIFWLHPWSNPRKPQ